MSVLSFFRTRSLLVFSILFLSGTLALVILEKNQLPRELAQITGLPVFYDDKIALEFLPEQGVLTIKISPTTHSSVNLSGWKIKKNNNEEFIIPLVVKTPRHGSVNQFEPFYVSPGDVIFIENNSSPLGYSFQNNKCAGFLDEFLSFSPPLGNSVCPNPESTGSPDHSCQVLLESLPSCRSNLAILPKSTSRECRAFIADRASYNYCVDNHKNDPDFYSAQWRLFIEKLSPVKGDNLALIDINGNTVTSVTIP